MSELKCPLMDKEVTVFKCNNSSIEQQIHDAYFITLMKQAYGHQIIINDKVIGYYMLCFKRVELEDVNAIMGEEYQSSTINYYTSMHIQFLAIDSRLQHKGIGTKVLQGVISEILALSRNHPIRLITLDALEEYHEWYFKNGFRDIPGKEHDGITIPMYVDCSSKEDVEKLEAYYEC